MLAMLLYSFVLATIYYSVTPCNSQSTTESCPSNEVYMSCGSVCGRNCIDVCNGTYPNTVCVLSCYVGCGCDTGTFWSENMDCCLDKLDCVIYDSECIELPNITNNYTLNELNLTIQEAKVLQEEADASSYDCDSDSDSSDSDTSDSSDSDSDGANKASIKIGIVIIAEIIGVRLLFNEM